RLGDRGPHEVLLPDELGVGERLAEEAQVLEAVLLEQAAREPGDGHVELGEAPGEVEHRGGGGVVLEASGVADDRRVEAYRGVAVEGEAELVDEAVDDPAAGGGVGVDD